MCEKTSEPTADQVLYRALREAFDLRLNVGDTKYYVLAELAADGFAIVDRDAAKIAQSTTEILLADSDAVIAQVVAMNGGQVPFGLNAPAVLRALSRHANLQKNIAEAKAEADAWGDPEILCREGPKP